MLTEKEKYIYNSYLIALRSNQNKPFQLRKDFDDIKPEVYTNLKKLSTFFDRNQSINISDFFKAPFKIDKNSYYEISFYNTRRALKCYTLYMKQKSKIDPDSQENIEECKSICKFLYKYCMDRGITLGEYKTLFEGKTPLILQHLKEHKINYYIIHALECSTTFQKIESDLLDFLIPDYNILLRETRMNFVRSKLKDQLREILRGIEQQLTKEKQQQTK
jgi:hypothetical protein